MEEKLSNVNLSITAKLINVNFTLGLYRILIQAMTEFIYGAKPHIFLIRFVEYTHN